MVIKRERRENCQSIMSDDERLNPQGFGNFTTRSQNKKTSRPHLETKEELSVCITDVLTNF